MILRIHPALLLLERCIPIPSLMHSCIGAGQVQVVLQLAGWPKYAQWIVLQLLQAALRQLPTTSAFAVT